MKHFDCDVRVVDVLKGKDPIDDGFARGQKVQPGEYTFLYRYPLSTVAKFKHKLGSALDPVMILRTAADDYQRIYREEDEGMKNLSPSGIPLNRGFSDGPWGIWGHDIGDLYFEGVIIDEKNGTVDFEMGS